MELTNKKELNLTVLEVVENLLIYNGYYRICYKEGLNPIPVLGNYSIIENFVHKTWTRTQI